jgi:hypothetical protein
MSLEPMQRHDRANAGLAPVIFRWDLLLGNRGGRLRAVLHVALATAAIGFAGCSTNTGSFDEDEPAQAKWNNLMALVEFKPLPKQPQPTDALVCPEIHILDGTSDDRIYAPGKDQSNESVRYQFSINDVARGCQINGNQVSMKIGVAGKVLLGPQGSPSTFPAPIRVAIIDLSDDSPVVSKLYQVPASVPDGQTEASFTLVTDPLSIPMRPNFAESYTIKVGFDSAGNGKNHADAQTASTDSSGATPDSSETPRHGHHHHRNLGGDSSDSGGSGNPD